MAKVRSLLGLVCLLAVLGYAVDVVLSAARHGLLAWGSLAEYSLVPYVVLLGFVCSLMGLFASTSDQGRAIFVVLFLATSQTLTDLKPISHVSADYRWAFDLALLASAASVIGLGAALVERFSTSPRRADQ